MKMLLILLKTVNVRFYFQVLMAAVLYGELHRIIPSIPPGGK